MIQGSEWLVVCCRGHREIGGLGMKEPAREGLLVDGAGAPLAGVDSGSVELLDGTRVAYHAIAPENASALQRFHHRLSERSIYLRFFPQSRS